MSAERQPPFFFQHFNFSDCSRKAARFVCALALMPSVQQLVAQPEAKDAVPVKADGEVIMMEAFGVEAETVKGSSGDLSNMRQKADVSIDFLSTEQIAKFSASDLAEAVIRIPGVSVSNGQFAVVRGLSDRYLSTTLQGLKIPSPDPEKQAVQMDLLPANSIGAIVVSKTYAPPLWAESGGGNIDILTTAFPEQQVIRVGTGVKFNSNALDGGPDYAVGDSFKERLGLGADSRLALGTNDPTWQYVPTRRDHFPLGNKFSLDYGRTFLLGEKKLGVSFSVMNETSTKQREGSKQAFFIQRGTAPSPGLPGTPSGFEDPSLPLSRGILWDYEESETESILGANATVAFQFSPDHEVKFNGLFVQSGIDVSQINQNRIVLDNNLALSTQDGYAGFSGAEQNAWFKTIEYYRERNLTDLQLTGKHAFPAAGDLGVGWAVQHATSYQKESPYLEATFATPLSDPFASYVVLGGNDAPDPLTVVWANNEETQDAARIDLDLPRALWTKEESVFKLGAATESTSRTVHGEALFYTNPGANVTGTTPNDVYQQITSVSPSPLSTQSAANREIKAVYAGTTLVVIPGVKAVAGARFEDFSLVSTGVGQWGNYRSTDFYSDTPGSGGFGPILGTTATNNPAYQSKEWYPGFGLIYEPVKTVTFRLNYSQTSGRPSLREVSPFFNKSIDTGNLVIGNPALQPSDVTSYDFRVEWNPSKVDSVALSLFHKEIANPVEKFLFNTAAQTSEYTESWINNPNTADLNGVEFEFRHGLGRWSEVLQGFSLGGNFTWIDAAVDEHPLVVSRAASNFQDPDAIPRSRRLYDQPEYIANMDLTWTHARWGTSVTLAANAISDVLKTVGLSEFTYDLYERAYVRYDFILAQRLTEHLKMKFSIKNLTDPVRGTIYDPEATNGTVERNHYRAGRDFSLSLTAEF